MMLAVSNAFNEAFKSDLREVKMRIKINDVTYTDEDIISFNFNSGSIVGETFAIGSTYANSIKLTLCKIVEDLKQLDVVVPEMGIVLPDGSTEYVKLGAFLISEEVNPDRNENRTSLECTDRMLMLDDFYESKLKYPAQIREVALEIANLAGVEVDKVSFGRLRQDKIKQPIGYTHREAIGLIAQFEAGYATFDRNGLLAIRLLEDKDYRVTPDEYFLKGLVKNELMFRPAGIQVSIGDEEEKFLNIGNKKGSVIKLENKLMTETLLRSIHEKVKTVNYYPYSLNWRGNPAVEAGDWLRVTDTKGNQFKVPNLSYSLEYKGGLTATSTVETVASNEVKMGYKTILEQTIEYVNESIKSDGVEISWSVEEPPNPKEGDIWFKYNGPDTEILIYEKIGEPDKFDWVLRISSAVNEELLEAIEDARLAAEDAKKAGEEAKKAGEDAWEKALDAEKAGQEALAKGEDAKKVGEEAKLAGEQASKDAEDAKNKTVELEKLSNDTKLKSDKALEEAGIARQEAFNSEKLANEAKADVSKAQSDIANVKAEADKKLEEAGKELETINGKVEKQGLEVKKLDDSLQVQSAKVEANTASVASLKVESDKIATEVVKTNENLSTMYNNTTNLLPRKTEIKDKIVVQGGGIVDFNGCSVTNEYIDVFEGDHIYFWQDLSGGEQNSYFRYAYYTEKEELVLRLAKNDLEWVEVAPKKARKLRVSYSTYNKVKVAKTNKEVGWSPAPEDAAPQDEVTKLSTKIEQTAEAVKIKADKTEVDSINKTVKENKAQIEVHNEQIQLKASQSAVDTINDTMKVHESEIKVHSEQIKLQTTKIENHTTEIANIKIESGKISTTVAKVETDLENLEVGTRNLFRGYPGNQKLEVKLSDAYFYSYPFVEKDTQILLKASTEYIVEWSCNIVKTNNDDLFLSFGYAKKGSGFNLDFGRVHIKDKTYRFKTKDDLGDMPFLGIRFSRTDKPTTSQVDYFDISVRESNVLSDWSPAPEDLATVTELSSVVQTVDTLQSTVKNKAEQSQVTQLAGQIDSTVKRVDGTESKITQLSNQINLKVSANEVISRINMSPEQIIIDSKLIRLSGKSLIDDAVIKNAHIGSLSVSESKIDNLAVSTAKIADLAVNSAKIAYLAVDTSHIRSLAVTTAKIDDLAVNSAKIGNLAVTNGKIANLAVDSAKIANLAVTTVKIGDGAITNAKIGNAAIDNAKIQDASISDAKIISITANKVVARDLSAITTNTGTLNISGWMSILTDNMGIRGSFDYGDTAETATFQRWHEGDFSISHRVLAFKGHQWKLRTNGTKGSYHGWSESTYGMNHFKSRLYTNSSTTSLIGRVDIRDDFIQVNDNWVTDETSGTWIKPNYIVATSLRTYDVSAKPSVNFVYFNEFRKDLADFRIGKDGVGKAVVSEAIYNRTYNSQPTACITDEGRLGRIVSAKKYKDNIEVADDVISKAKTILSIEPKSWTAKNSDSGIRHYGFIADDFHDSDLKEVVLYSHDEVEGLSYDRITMYHNVVLSEHEKEINKLHKKINKLEELLSIAG